jgi:hypothetical protein
MRVAAQMDGEEGVIKTLLHEAQWVNGDLPDRPCAQLRGL